MNAIDLIRPTTMVGIRRLAKQIKKAKGVTHAEALDQAAVAAGYQNFRHARRMLDEA
jgi:hypothetical protein